MSKRVLLVELVFRGFGDVSPPFFCSCSSLAVVSRSLGFAKYPSIIFSACLASSSSTLLYLVNIERVLWPVSFIMTVLSTPAFPRIGGPCVAEIMKTETLYSRLLHGIGQRRLDRFADKPLSLASLCSAYPHLLNPQQMVATRTYPSRRTDNLPFFSPSAHGSFLLFNYPNFSPREKHFLTFMMPQFLKRFLPGL